MLNKTLIFFLITSREKKFKNDLYLDFKEENFFWLHYPNKCFHIRFGVLIPCLWKE